MKREFKTFLEHLAGRTIAIGGNRWITKRTAREVERVTAKIIRAGCVIVTGGAEGVDHAILRTCLRLRRLRPHFILFLPYTIEKQYEHYQGLEGTEKARRLLKTLQKIQRVHPRAIHENYRRFSTYRKAADARNRRIERLADGFVIFKPKGSKGSIDAVKAAMRFRKPYLVF